MKSRIPLQIAKNKVILTALIESPRFRIRKQILDFVLDTGSEDSYLSEKEAMRLQMPLKGKPPVGEVDFGGSRFKQISLPKITMYLLKEDKQKNDCLILNVSLFALKTTKTSSDKARIACALPSILGMNFLIEQNLSLHLIPREGIAYLGCEA